MRILVIPDVHLKTNIFDMADKVDTSKYDNIVCLEDLIDEWRQQNNQTAYEETLERVLDDEAIEKLKEIFEYIDSVYDEPETANSFVKVFKNEDSEDYFEDYNIWQEIKYIFPTNALKIYEVFDEHIKPHIQKLLQENKVA